MDYGSRTTRVGSDGRASTLPGLRGPRHPSVPDQGAVPLDMPCRPAEVTLGFPGRLVHLVVGRLVWHQKRPWSTIPSCASGSR